MTGSDVGIHCGEENQCDPEQVHHHSARSIVADPESGINHHEPDGNCGSVKEFITAQQGDQRIQCGCCNWQENLVPHVQRFTGPFHTGEHNAGHCRSNHAQRHQPGQHIFAADIKMCSSIHTSLIYQNSTDLAIEKVELSH